MKKFKRFSKILSVFLVIAMILPGIAQAAPLSDGEVKRLKGSNRVKTAINISKETYKNGSETVIVAGYNGSADALTGTLLASDNDAPLLLAPSRQNNLPEFTKEVKRLGAKKVYILGGNAAVPDFVETKLNNIGLNVERLSGSNRYGTAVSIAEETKNKDKIFITLGKKMLEDGTEDALSDALSIGPVSAKEGRPVLLTQRNKLPNATKEAIKKFGVEKATIVGGELAIMPKVKKELEKMGIAVDRISGSNRYDTATKIAKDYFGSYQNTILASGVTDTDALLGGYLGALFDSPILLTNNKNLSKQTKEYIINNSNGSYILGGNAVISDSIFKEIQLANNEERTTEKINNAVYIGVLNYNTMHAKYKDDFYYRFNINGDEEIFKISEENDYLLNNLLAEGYIFDLVVNANNTIVDISTSEPSAEGVIESFDTKKIKVNDKNIKINEETNVYSITSKAGGSKVEGSNLDLDETVKVYGNPAKNIYLTSLSKPYKAPIKGTPNKRTIKNLLATAMEPVGTSLYIYGGAWDWQDVGSSNQATTIGISQKWIDFFQNNNKSYTYKNSDEPTKSYYPHQSYNQYYYAGVDCSGYVGWAMYNIMNDQSGKEGFVEPSTTMAKTFAETYNYGTWTQDFTSSTFKAGDNFSMAGHIWICLGVCDDDSLVILHSTPSDSYEGKPGGGVQISGVGEDEDCEAYILAQEYMQKYFPEWSNRYPAVFKSYDDYTATPNDSTGKFSWHLDEDGLLDPDGYTEMSAKEILQDLFDENK